MTTKEKVILESISRLKKRIKELEEIKNATPLLDIIEIREELKQLLEQNKSIESRTSDNFIKKIEKLHNKEKKAFKIAKKQNYVIDELVNNQNELQELESELFYIKR